MKEKTVLTTIALFVLLAVSVAADSGLEVELSPDPVTTGDNLTINITPGTGPVHSYVMIYEGDALTCTEVFIDNVTLPCAGDQCENATTAAYEVPLSATPGDYFVRVFDYGEPDLRFRFKDYPYEVIACTESSGVNLTGLVMLLQMNNDTSLGEGYAPTANLTVADSSTFAHECQLDYDRDDPEVYPTATQSAPFNGGLSFDGNASFVSCGTPSQLDVTSDLTVCGWFYTDDHSAIISKQGHFGSLAWRLNSFGFSVSSDGLQSGTTNHYLADTPRDSWHFICGVHDDSANKLRLYVNGTLALTPVTHTGGISSEPSQLVSVGGRIYGNNKDVRLKVNGSLDDISVWNRTLSAAEIMELYENGVMEESETSCGPDTVPLPEITSNVTEGVGPLTVNFTPIVIDGDAPFTYLWQFGDNQSSTLENPVITYSTPGIYVVDLNVTDVDSDSGYNTTNITVWSALPFCNDPDGLNITTQTTVHSFNGFNDVNETDVCFAGKLFEAICDAEDRAAYDAGVFCPNGTTCSSGACV